LRGRKRIGRSPGKGDAVVMCWSEGNRALKRTMAWIAEEEDDGPTDFMVL
jgi:hypothetical protein